jgi:hypothetical protein
MGLSARKAVGTSVALADGAPEPEIVADAAARADEQDGEPATRAEAGQRAEEPSGTASRARKPTEASIAKALTGSAAYRARYGR